MEELDVALSDATALLHLDADLSWYFMYQRFGQRCELKEELGPSAFGLAEQLKLDHVERFSAHLALNFESTEPGYSLLWNRQMEQFQQ